MRCHNCDYDEIEADDNFCPMCGYLTTKGYSFFQNKNNVKKMINNIEYKNHQRVGFLVTLLGIGIIAFSIMFMIRGDSLYAPFSYLKKKVNNYVYGFNTSIIKTDNKYNQVKINDYDEAVDFIKKDFKEQSYICDKAPNLSFLEYNLENDYAIPSVSFCDMDYEESIKIKNVIEKMYELFPNIKGSLTNITITNAKTNSEYIALFQPMYQFVNVNDSIKKYNKVNKTQILLNSYYFLNEDILKKRLEDTVSDGWYVKDATWESVIAHELGHYITFKVFLKENNLENITLVTEGNYELYDKLLEEFDKGLFQDEIVNLALDNYNQEYNTNISIIDFAGSISNYSKVTSEKNKIITAETIAEAIHDYYLHGDKMENSSRKIIEIIKEKLG